MVKPSAELSYDNFKKWKLLISKARSFKKNKKYGKAIEYYNKSLTIYPNDSNTLNSIGALLLEKEEYHKALNFFNMSTKFDDENVDAWNNTGLAYYYQEKYREATGCFKKAKSLEESNEDSLHYLGHCYQYLERYEDATKCFKKLTEAHPHDSHYWAERGNLLIDQSQYSKSIEFLDRSIRVNPRDLQALAGKGGALYALEKFDRAIIFLKRALKIDSRDGYTLHYLGHCFQDLGKHTEAIKYFEKELMIEEEPFEDTWYELGMLYFEIKRYEEAIKKFKNALSIDDVNIKKKSLRKIAESYSRLGKDTNARKFFDKLEQIKLKKRATDSTNSHKIKRSLKQNDKSKSLEKPLNNKNVFIIHGHDLSVLDAVTKFLRRKFSIQAVPLLDQPSASSTIIEKLEDAAKKAHFAIALFTPDDEGRVKEKKKRLEPRPRQNVIFELGYFFARLGRNKTCVITKIQNVDSEFSDYKGILDIKMDEKDDWKHKLETELCKAGIVSKTKLK